MLNKSENFRCPLDQIEIELSSKDINQFARNLALLEAMEEIKKPIPIQERRSMELPTNDGDEYCPNHPTKVLDLLCMDCKFAICAMCQFDCHQGHQLRPMEKCDEIEMKEETIQLIRKCVNDIEGIDQEYEYAIQIKEETLTQKVSIKFQDYIEMLQKQHKVLSEQLKMYFKVLREDLRPSPESKNLEDRQVYNWKEDAKNKLSILENMGLKELMQEKTLITELGVEAWLQRQKKEEILTLDARLNNVNVEFNEEFERQVECAGSFSTAGKDAEDDDDDDDEEEMQSNPGSEDNTSDSKKRRDSLEKRPSLEDDKLFLEENKSEKELAAIRKKELHETIMYIQNWREILKIPCEAKAEGNKMLKMSVNLKRDRKLNKFGFVITEGKSELLKKLTQKLEIKCQDISPKGMATLSKIISQSQCLTHLKLDFERCDIAGNGLTILSQSFAEIANLTFLRLSFSRCDNLNDFELMALAEELPQLHHLTYLELYFPGCAKISDPGVLCLVAKIPLCHQLTHLRLDFSRCSILSPNTQASLNNLLNSYIQSSVIGDVTSYLKDSVKGIFG
jgi:hypothetical protein